MLIDIHSHIPTQSSANLCFLVGTHSLGIHPWELRKERSMKAVEQEFIELKNKLEPSVLAIGECGLDRAREDIAPMEFQLNVLEWHLNWAREVRRPVVIHCVRAHSDLLMLLKKKRYEGKILLHDYAGNLDECMKFLNYDVYFSFGSRLMKEHSKTPQVFKNLPRERLFLETDDQKQFLIDDIYKQAGLLLKMDQSELEKLFYDNLLNFFSDLNNVSSSDLVTYLR